MWYIPLLTLGHKGIDLFSSSWISQEDPVTVTMEPNSTSNDKVGALQEVETTLTSCNCFKTSPLKNSLLGGLDPPKVRQLFSQAIRFLAEASIIFLYASFSMRKRSLSSGGHFANILNAFLSKRAICRNVLQKLNCSMSA